MSYLIVVAHPDDEVLGAGATIHKLVKKGVTVDVCILSADAEARNGRPDSETLRSDAAQCMNILGVRRLYAAPFPNIQLNCVPHLKLVQFIEQAMLDSGAEKIITHHPSDLNNDHHCVSLACQAATRLFQRREGVAPIDELWFMEVPSSTDWALNRGANGFEPNVFVEIGQDGLEAKLQALAAYRGVMRDFPHPRSAEAIRGLAAVRGAQAGETYAEAFQCVFRRER